MDKLDGRKYSEEAQEELRRIAVKMRKNGAILKAIKAALDICHSTICLAGKTYDEGGATTLKSKRRGCNRGERRTLAIDQEKNNQKKMIDKRPKQLKLDFALWRRDAVRLLIKQETSIDMPIRTFGEYLRSWGFTPQKRSNKGKVFWMMVDGTVNSDQFLEFLEGVVKDAERKIFLILNNLKVYHATRVKEWPKADKHLRGLA